MKNKIDWGFVIITTLGFVMDCFFIWFNLSFALEYFDNALYNQAALFGLGTIVWTLLLVRDGNDLREHKKFHRTDELVIIDKDKENGR